MTFFLGQNHKMGERFFSWRVEQAAIANAALPGTLNPKPASPLSTYWLALDFLPRHLEPGPSISPSLSPPAPQITAFGRRHLVIGSHISHSHLCENWWSKHQKGYHLGWCLKGLKLRYPDDTHRFFSYPHNTGFYIPLKWCPVGPHCHLLFTPHCPLKHVIYKVFKLGNPRMRSLNSPHQLFWFSPTTYHL